MLPDLAAQQLAAIVMSSSDAIVSKDIAGIVVSWNPGAERMFGYTAAEMIGHPITMVIPPDRLAEEASILERIRRGEAVANYETVRRCKNGTLIEVSLAVSPVRDVQGHVVGASKIARDITERRRAQERQTLLLREMRHRVKNLFALANSLVVLSARHATTPADVAAAVQARLGALGRAHDLTMPELAEGNGDEKPASLRALVDAITAPYADASGSRFTVRGHEVKVRGSAMTALALLLNELATNAAKYGALSSDTGRVEVAWSQDAQTFCLTWQESGGQRPTGPEGEGFGSFLIRAAVTGQLSGQVSREWTADGLKITLSVPLQVLG